MKVLVLYCGFLGAAGAMLASTASVSNFMAYAGPHPNDPPNDAPTAACTDAFLKNFLSALNRKFTTQLTKSISKSLFFNVRQEDFLRHQV